MTEDFDNIFEEPEKTHPPNPIIDELLNPIKEIMKEVMTPIESYGWVEKKQREFQARTFLIGGDRTDPAINEFFKAGWHIHLMQSFERQLLIIFCREIQEEPRP